ncbi:MAG: hypothetical protein WKF47_19810 [Geodermatophilaceae bacterium]
MGGVLPVGRVQAHRGRREHSVLLVVDVRCQHLERAEYLRPMHAAGTGAIRCGQRRLHHLIQLIVLVEKSPDLVGVLPVTSHGRVEREFLNGVMNLKYAIQLAQ